MTAAEIIAAQDRWTLALQDGEKVKVLYRPTPKGAEFHELTIPNAILEGPRGTGKSMILRNDAHIHALKCPGLHYLVVRRTFPELRKSHLKFIEAEMKALGGYFLKTENVAYYPNGSKGFYGHCETDADTLNYLSSEFARVYLDEITTFPGEMILKLASCCRVPEDSEWVAALRGGTNPLGEGADFVQRWFITKDVQADESEDYDPADYYAMPMVLEDNPHLDWVQYRRRLANLPEHIRRAWLDGEWRVEGAYFLDFKPTKGDIPWHVIPEMPTMRGRDLVGQKWVTIYRAYDHGFDPDPAVCLWIAVLPNGTGIAFKEKTWLRTTAADIAKDIIRESAGMRIAETYCDPSVFVGSTSTGSSVGDIIERNGVPLTASINDRSAIGLSIHEWLLTVIDEQPKIRVLREGCPMLVRTIPEMRADKARPERIADHKNDHWTITLGYFCQTSVPASYESMTTSVPTWMKKKTKPAMGNRNVRLHA